MFRFLFSKGLLLIFYHIYYSSLVQQIDHKLAPNSYLFDPHQEIYDGLFIPVAKAYAMWEEDPLMGGTSIPTGVEKAEVYWEDHHGLIRCGNDYTLEIIGAGRDAKIKVPINKSKEGNALIIYKVN